MTLELPAGVKTGRIQLTDFDKSRITFYRTNEVRLLANKVQISWALENVFSNQLMLSEARGATS